MARPLPVIVWLQDTEWSLPRAETVLCQPQARALGFEATHSMQEEHGRKINFYDSWTDSSPQWYWLRLRDKQDWFGVHLERTVSRIAWIQGALRHLPCTTTLCSQSPARAVGCESAPQLQEDHGRKSKSHYSWAYSSTRRYWFQLGDTQDWLGINLERTISRIAWIQGAIRSLARAVTVFCQSQAWAVGCASALQLQDVSRRKAKSHDTGAHSSTRWYWFQRGNNQDDCCFSERTISCVIKSRNASVVVHGRKA